MAPTAPVDEVVRTATSRDAGRQPRWRDPKRYLWLLGSIVPGLVALAWLAVHASSIDAFWWSGPILAFGLIPLLDHIVGSDSESPPDSALAWLEDDPFYRWVTYLYLPGQYLSLIFACWLWAGGGWLTMTFVDRLGLMLTVGTIGGVAINAAHELGHRRSSLEQRL